MWLSVRSPQYLRLVQALGPSFLFFYVLGLLRSILIRNFGSRRLFHGTLEFALIDKSGINTGNEGGRLVSAFDSVICTNIVLNVN
ncbi:MAG: hypothetical protein DWQ35_05665 [Planctomycetota bacterium]|nr:MAG: hypothetical protein DWQ35_05665 [Planctomycetota bacterium]